MQLVQCHTTCFYNLLRVLVECRCEGNGFKLPRLFFLLQGLLPASCKHLVLIVLIERIQIDSFTCSVLVNGIPCQLLCLLQLLQFKFVLSLQLCHFFALIPALQLFLVSLIGENWRPHHLGAFLINSRLERVLREHVRCLTDSADWLLETAWKLVFFLLHLLRIFSLFKHCLRLLLRRLDSDLFLQWLRCISEEL